MLPESPELKSVAEGVASDVDLAVPRWRAGLPLGLLLVLALWLRLDGIAFGLDFADPSRAFFTNHVDARGMVNEVEQRFLRGDLNPGTFLFRGPATFHLFGLADGLAAGVWSLWHPGGWSGVLAELSVNPSLLHLVHRLIAALAGVASVWLVHRILARELERTSALCAAAILAVAYLHVRDSHFGTVDVLSGLVTLAALERMLALQRTGAPRTYLAAGLLAGAGAAVKYFGVLLGAHLLLAHVFARAAARAEGRSAPGWGPVVLGSLACPLGFFLVSPGALVHVDELVRHMLFDVDTLSPALDGTSQWGSLVFHGTYTLWYGLGEPVLVLALLGLPLLWRAGRAGRFLVLSAAGLAPTLFATWVHNARYGIPFLVLLVPPAAAALAALLARAPRNLRPVLVVLVLAPSLVRSQALDRLLQQPDTRVEMLAELRARALPAREVLAVGSALDLPVPERPGDAPFVPYATRVVGTTPLGIAAVEAAPPRAVLLSLATPAREIPDWPRLEALLAARYREVLRLESRADGWPEREERVGTPALQIPYARPWEQERPGPPFVLYERVD